MHQHGGDCQSDDDSERDAPVVADEKVVPEHREGAQRADHDASTGAAEVAADRARTARSRATASSENATNTASRTRIAASPRTANPMLPWLAAKVTTMKATSSPSSTTALNDKVNAYQSGTANRRCPLASRAAATCRA